MNSKDPPALLELHYPDHIAYHIFDRKMQQFVPLDEPRLSKAIPGYTLLNETARQRERKSFIKGCLIIRKIQVPDLLLNFPPKPRLPKLDAKEQEEAIRTFLSIGSIFESPRAGYLLMSDILCGLHCQALRKAEPGFHPAISVHSDSQEILKVLRRVTKTATPLSYWVEDKTQIWRTAVLDYRTQPDELPHHIQDFSEYKRRISGYKRIRFPMAYTNSPTLLINASASQVRETTPYLEDSSVLLLNSEPGDFKPTKLSSADCSAYAPEIVRQLKRKRKLVGALLRWWWCPNEKENAWAAQIVREARDSFGKADSKYISTELDPKLLRDRIRYHVLLRFLDELEDYEYMVHEDLEPYRQTAKEVFDPAPPEPVVIRHAEDPEVFIEVMRALTVEKANSIIANGDRFVRSDKPFGAWRTISNVEYLVMLEDKWAKEYKAAVKARKDLEGSCFQSENWTLDVLKAVADKEYIKHTGKNPRYRYDLMENGTRDTTYVVAIPAELLRP